MRLARVLREFGERHPASGEYAMSDKKVGPENAMHELQADDCDFHVVGVGASAGGLEALESFFGEMPPDSGAAFVVVQHLSPDFKSHMEHLLSRQTAMAVFRVEDRMHVKPNSIYLIPPKKEMIISEGKLLLTDKDTKSLAHPIDQFFRSLATDCGRFAIGIVCAIWHWQRWFEGYTRNSRIRWVGDRSVGRLGQVRRHAA